MRTLRELRKAKGWSQQVLVEKAGVSAMTVSRTERGEAIRQMSALRMCEVLGVPLEQVEGLKTSDDSALSLRALRKAQSLERVDLAEAAGVSLKILTAMENKGTVSQANALKVCEALGVPLEQVEGLHIYPRAVNFSPLRALREAKSWSQQALVEKAGVSLPVIVNIEKGRAVSQRSAEKVCQALGVPLEQVEGLKISVLSQAGAHHSPLRALRIAKGWSQQKLAQETGISVATLLDMENGKAVNRLGMLLVCQALGVSVEDVIALNLFSKVEVEWYRFLLNEVLPGERIPLRTLREAKGWTQQRLAEAAGVTHDLISRAETGKNINRMSALKICRALGVPSLTYAEELHITSSMRGQASFDETDQKR